jgi:hypothetical protein
LNSFQSSLEWFQSGGAIAAPDASVPAVAQAIGAATDCVSLVADSRRNECLRAALAIAGFGATLFEPRFSGPAELRWSGPTGEPAPLVSFERDFIDRRTVVAWSLYRLTTATLVDEPIFSAQARVTMHGLSLATFRNFNKPAGTLVSNEASVSEFEPEGVPQSVREELLRSSTPLVYVVMREFAGFDDIILYTALFNFSRAFCAFQTGPWRALRRSLAQSQPLLDSLVLSHAEIRAVQRAALAAMESAWEASYRLPIQSMQPSLLGILSQALSEMTA